MLLSNNESIYLGSKTLYAKTEQEIHVIIIEVCYISCSRCLLIHELLCLTCLMPYVLLRSTCSRTSLARAVLLCFTRALQTLVPCVPRILRAIVCYVFIVPCVMCFLMSLVLCAMRALVFHLESYVSCVLCTLVLY